MVGKSYINGECISNADHRDNPFVEAEISRQGKAKEEAKELGFEVLTPQAATVLFGISASAVRQARLGEHVYTSFTVDLTGRPLHLLKLQSAIEYWQDKKQDDFDDMLEDMRGNGHILSVGGICYNVLHDKPTVRMDEIETVLGRRGPSADWMEAKWTWNRPHFCERMSCVGCRPSLCRLTLKADLPTSGPPSRRTWKPTRAGCWPTADNCQNRPFWKE